MARASPAPRRLDVVLLPGFGGQATQPLLGAVARALDPARFACRPLAPPRARLTPELGPQVDWLLERLAEVPGPHVLVGRSFGGRLCARAALRRDDVAACVLLAFPVRPPGKARPLDEAALSSLRCPTLVVQGSRDALGPLATLRPLVAGNPALALHVLTGVPHAWPAAAAREAVQATARFLHRFATGAGLG